MRTGKEKIGFVTSIPPVEIADEIGRRIRGGDDRAPLPVRQAALAPEQRRVRSEAELKKLRVRAGGHWAYRLKLIRGAINRRISRSCVSCAAPLFPQSHGRTVFKKRYEMTMTPCRETGGTKIVSR